MIKRDVNKPRNNHTSTKIVLLEEIYFWDILIVKELGSNKIRFVFTNLIKLIFNSIINKPNLTMAD